MMLEGDSCCSAHCSGRFMCDEDQSSMSFCVAGALFGDVGGRLLFLRALNWTVSGVTRINHESHFRATRSTW